MINKMFYDLTKVEGNIELAEETIARLRTLAFEQRLLGEHVASIETEESIRELQTNLDFYIADNFPISA